MLEDLSLRKAVAFAIKTEELGGQFYQHLEKKFAEHAELKEIFALLARDEALHEKQFKTLLEKVPDDDEKRYGYEQGQYLRAMAISEIFNDENSLHRNIDQIKTKEDALERALNMEKATLLYYDAMKNILGDEPLLEAIIRSERNHVVQIMKYLVGGAKVRGIEDKY